MQLPVHSLLARPALNNCIILRSISECHSDNGHRGPPQSNINQRIIVSKYFPYAELCVCVCVSKYKKGKVGLLAAPVPCVC